MSKGGKWQIEAESVLLQAVWIQPARIAKAKNKPVCRLSCSVSYGANYCSKLPFSGNRPRNERSERCHFAWPLVCSRSSPGSREIMEVGSPVFSSGVEPSEEAKLLENPKGCFFIYDTHHHEETADPEEFMLFFYPEVLGGKKLSAETKSYLLGACSALITFAQRYLWGKVVEIYKHLIRN